MPHQPDPLRQPLTDHFITSIENIINQSVTGISEYELMTRLTEKGFFPTANQNASLELFQKHFLIFHVLYLINDKLVSNQLGGIKISPLNIKKLENTNIANEIDQYDPLRDYYLDLNNLESTNEEQVNELLNAFWACYLRNDKRQVALAILDLKEPTNNSEIKSRYRRLAKAHHPDKGGQTSKAQEINEAYKFLIKDVK